MALQDNPDFQPGLRQAAASNAMAGRPEKLTRQWLGYDNSIPRYVFPASKTWWALIGVLKTSRDMKKDCGEPGCPNDHRSRFSPVATRIE
jgi:hypothetical protein